MAEGEETLLRGAVALRLRYHAPMSKLSILGELWRFMNKRKKWWLMPMLLVIVFFGILMVFAQTSPLAPFIYTLI